jgi:hypothetical protein
MRVFHLIAGTVVLSLSGGCAFPWSSSTPQKTESRDVGAFTAVLARGSIVAEIRVVPDQPPSVEVSGDEDLVPLVRTAVSSDRLVVEMPATSMFLRRAPVVTISTPTLSRLEANDSARATSDTVLGEEVSVTSRDSSQVTVDTVTAEKAASITASGSSITEVGSVAAAECSITASDSSMTEVGSVAAAECSITASGSSMAEARDVEATGALAAEVEGSSMVTVDGAAAALDAEVSHSSQLHAGQLEAGTVDIDVSTSSQASVCATASLDAAVKSSSAVSYDCDPEEVSEDLDGSSTLTEE